jgi:hypothetical protein
MCTPGDDYILEKQMWRNKTRSHRTFALARTVLARGFKAFRSVGRGTISIYIAKTRPIFTDLKRLYFFSQSLVKSIFLSAAGTKKGALSMQMAVCEKRAL